MERTKPTQGRLERDQYFMNIAEVVAKRGTCPKAKVGAVLVDPSTNRLVATGYNGSVPYGPHCIDEGCLEVDLGTGHGKSCIRTVHAELNAILHLDRRYDKLVLYSTHQPCFQCFKALVTANVTDIFYLKPYTDKVRDLLHKETRYINMKQLILA